WMSPLSRRSSQVGATFSGELAAALAGLGGAQAVGHQRAAVSKFACTTDRQRRLTVQTCRTRAVVARSTILWPRRGLRLPFAVEGRRGAYEGPGAVRLGRAAGQVAFRHVTFGYERGKPVLHDVDFAVAPGEVIGVVGKSGSGKTTVMQLLRRFYDVDEGRIEL